MRRILRALPQLGRVTVYAATTRVHAPEARATALGWAIGGVRRTE
jgi:hypothetical protein